MMASSDGCGTDVILQQSEEMEEEAATCVHAAAAAAGAAGASTPSRGPASAALAPAFRPTRGLSDQCCPSQRR